MKHSRSSVCFYGFLVVLLFARGGAIFADPPKSVAFGTLSVSYDASRDPAVASLSDAQGVFAEAEISRDAVAECAVDDDALVLKMRDGREFAFSDACARRGFVAIDYVLPAKTPLIAEEPLRWRARVFAPERLEKVKAFGTAGVRPVDGHAGSYAFIALVDPESRAGLVGGWVTSEKASGVVRSETRDGAPTMIPRLDFGRFQSGSRVFTERFVLGRFDDCRLGLEAYADAIAEHYSIVLKRNCLNGYCTWYSDKNGGASNENALKELTRAIKDDFGDFGMQFVQIDCGWQLGQSKNGPNKDFTAHNSKGAYPSGMKAAADAVADRGFVAGLWFMPFSGNYDDPYFADKQDLFARSAIDYPLPGEKNVRRYAIDQKKGSPYETFWGGTCFDLSNPKTRDYVKRVAERITQDWNFKYVKLDGIWCGGAMEQLYVNDEYIPDDLGEQIFFNPESTNIENFRAGLQIVRDAAKDAFILGCNVAQNMRVMASSYGLVDAMRIGPDNGPSWKGILDGPKRGSNRYFYNGRVWYNDPDPVYARPSVPLEQARVSATWTGLTGQLYALSDWIPDYDAERVDLVRKTIPNHHCLNVRPVDLFDVDLPRVWLLTDDKSGVRRDVVGIFNWDEENAAAFKLSPEKLGLPLVDEQGKKIEKYVAYDFWGDKLIEPFETLDITLPNASCAALAVRPVGDRPVLLSTSRHVAQGALEVKSEEWDPTSRTLKIVADVPSKIRYEMRVYDPRSGKMTRFATPEGEVGVKAFKYDAETGVFSADENANTEKERENK